MAEQNNNAKAAAPEASKRKLPVRTMIIMAVVLLVEGLAIAGAFMLSGGAADVKADPAKIDEAAKLEQPVEELVLDGRFANMRLGYTVVYTTKVVVKVKRKHQDRVQQAIEQRAAELEEAVQTIFRRAEPTQLKEPTLATLRRQVQAELDRIFQQDENGEPIVLSVVIPKCIPHRADM